MWFRGCERMCVDQRASKVRVVMRRQQRSVIPAQAHDCPGKRDAVNRDASSSPTPSFPRRRESKQTTTNWAFLATRLDPHLRGDDDREWRGRRSKYRVPCGRNRSNPTDPGRFDDPMLNFSGQYCAQAGNHAHRGESDVAGQVARGVRGLCLGHGGPTCVLCCTVCARHRPSTRGGTPGFRPTRE